jgi:hypothetical protein
LASQSFTEIQVSVDPCTRRFDRLMATVVERSSESRGSSRTFEQSEGTAMSNAAREAFPSVDVNRNRMASFETVFLLKQYVSGLIR